MSRGKDTLKSRKSQAEGVKVFYATNVIAELKYLRIEIIIYTLLIYVCVYIYYIKCA